MDPFGQPPAKPAAGKQARKLKAPRASTSNKNRTTRSPSPYRSRPGQSTTEFVNEFWQHTVTTAEGLDDDFKHQALPLARIKKVMKSDPEVRMISSEVTIIFEKACQIFIQELTARSHLVSLASKRRTLSRPDVAEAISKSDMFDFLIDIVPRQAPAPVPVSTGKSTEGTKKNGSRKRKAEKEVSEEEEEEEEENGDEEGEEEEGDEGEPEDPYGMGMAHADVGTRHGTEVEGNGINWPGGSFGYSNVQGHNNYYDAGPSNSHQ